MCLNADCFKDECRTSVRFYKDDKIYRVKPDSIYKIEAAALIRAKEMNDQTNKNWDLIDKSNKETEI